MATATQALSLARLTTPIKVVIVLAALVAVGLLYYVLLHTEVGAKIDGARRNKGQLEAQLADARQSQASYFQDRDELVMRQQRQRELNKVLPADTEAAAFLSSIQQVSNVSGIDLKAWQPQEESTQTFFAKVPMRLEISGRFHQLAKFVYEVGKLDRIINMENIELFEPRLEGDDVIVHARCLATTFHTVKPKTPPPGTPPQPQQGGQK
jgi:type IV pilus assembly protein PilO